MMTVIPLAVLCFSLICLAGYTFFTIRYREGGEQEQIGSKPLPMVSILKPLRHIDDEIEKNFESFFTLDYPRFEILFGVDLMDDPLVGIISSLRARYPHVPVKVIDRPFCH
jgi:ceramide glucosyltransferase